MAKTSSVEKNNRRARMAKQYAAKRAKLKAMAVDDKLTPEERFGARLKLSELPRNSSPTRIRNRCEITGQKPVVTKSRKSIATFKLREGMAIGAKVTLRRDRMYEFIDRLVNIALPRVRDFRGLNGKSFDGNGNYAMGLKEQIVFPEIDYDKVDVVRGMDIIICTSAKTDAEAKALLRGFDFPFVN